VSTRSPQSAAFFEQKYRASADPWNFATAHYEQRRYAATLAALPRPTYARAFEPGCSVGVLTAALARRCTRVEACDLAATAVAHARVRCRELPNVTISERDVCAAPLENQYDLIVFSEIGYYFSTPELRALVRRLTGALQPGGDFLAVHWLGQSADHVLHGDEVHRVIAATLPGDLKHGMRHAGFRIDVWRREAE
jgi:trans-aconitate methyltransferase